MVAHSNLLLWAESYLAPIFGQHHKAVVVNQEAAEILDRKQKCLVCEGG